MSARVDIAVVGAGAAGIAAAVVSARSGHPTLLLDDRLNAGGTGGHSGLTTLCGLFDDAGNYLNEGFSREFADAVTEAAPLKMGKVYVLPYRPARFRDVADRLIRAEKNLRPVWNTPVQRVTLTDDRVTHVNEWEVGAVIDCSGTAEVARAAGADCLATDEKTQAPAVIFALENVRRDLGSPAAVAQVLLPLARAGFPPLTFHSEPEPTTLTVKFTGRPDQAKQVIEFLRAKVPGFEQCRTPSTEFKATSRAGRMIVGRQLLTGADVLAAQHFPDAIARCAWPIEQWGADGVARYRYLPDGTHYDIPAGCLRAAKIQNLFMAGKTISADVDAIASARVMGCCLATGAAAGNLAARWLQSTLTA